MTDPTLHGGAVTKGCATVTIGGLPAARVMDSHACSQYGHIGGLIGKGSATVSIGGKSAARMGDPCGCIMAGVSGAGAPGASGPGGAGGGSGGGDSQSFWNGDAKLEDTDGDGTPDKLSAKGSVAEEEKNFKLGDAKAKAKVKMGYAEAESNFRGTDTGGKASAKAEGGLVKEGVEVETNPQTGDKAGVEVDGGHGEAHGDFFMGDDGERVGYGSSAKAAAEAAAIKFTQQRTYELFGYSVVIQEEVSGSAGAVGGGAGGWAYYNKKSERFHMGGFGSLKILLGLGIKGDVSVGKASGGAVQTGIMAGIPNLIVSGCPNVLIGG